MKRTLILMLAAGCLFAAIAGYRLGRDQAGQPRTVKSDPRSTRVAAVEVAAERRSEAFAALKAGVMRSYHASPSAEHDWILRGHTAALLAGMTPAELARLLDEILVGRDDDRLQRTAVAQRVLVTDLLRAWGHKDPRAACTARVESSISAAGRQVAFRDWLLRDPDSVAQWMKSGEDLPEDLRKVWLSERLKVDPQDALRQLADLAPEAREAALLEWSTLLALRPAEREALLAATADDPALQRKCAGLIAGALADLSVGEARAFVDGLEFDQQSTTTLHDGIFMRWAAREPQAAFADWAARRDDRVSNAHLRALDNWSLNSPGTEEAILWLATIHPGPAKEKIQLQFINDLTGRERFEQAVRMGLSMDDREEGIRQAMRAAAAWKEKFPKDAQDRLQVISREAGIKLP
jgi:hypothetical protein